MDKVGNFKIELNGEIFEAVTIMNFSLYDSYYCIYGIKNMNNGYDVYCGQIIGNKVVPIDNEKDKSFNYRRLRSYFIYCSCAFLQFQNRHVLTPLLA